MKGLFDDLLIYPYFLTRFRFSGTFPSVMSGGVEPLTSGLRDKLLTARPSRGKPIEVNEKCTDEENSQNKFSEYSVNL